MSRPLGHGEGMDTPLNDYQRGLCEEYAAKYPKPFLAVKSMVPKFYRKAIYFGLTDDDISQIAFDGVMRASQKYDGREGVAFSSYACWHIKNRVKHVIERMTRQIRHPKGKRIVSEYCIAGNYDISVFNFLPCQHYKSQTSKQIQESVKERSEKALKGLSGRNLEIVKMYYGLAGCEKMTFKQIGDRYNITGEFIRQQLNKSLLRMKEYLLGSVDS